MNVEWQKKKKNQSFFPTIATYNTVLFFFPSFLYTRRDRKKESKENISHRDSHAVGSIQASDNPNYETKLGRLSGKENAILKICPIGFFIQNLCRIILYIFLMVSCQF